MSTAEQTTLASPQAETTQSASSDPKQDAVMMALNVIHKIPGHNPRRYRSKREVNELRESIRDKYVIQAILVRPHPTLENEFQLVAGETRYDLSVECGHTQIPVVIREISDEELLTFAATENLKRNNMVPMDEGEAAKALLIKHEGNKELVCKELGWSLFKLNGRIQLTYCTPEVSQALCDEEINIGHAEILSSLRESSQNSALKMVIKKNLTSDQLRQRIDALSLQLAVAAFDTSDCAACPHNSSTQASLFDAKTDNGKCLNKACFDQKSEDHLQMVKSSLSETFNRVELSRDVASETSAIIATSGPQGVGQEQFDACVSCEHYGATINSQIGNRAHVTRNVCFNVPCNTKMVAEYQHVIATDTTPHTTQAVAGSTASNATKASKKKGDAAPKKVATPTAIVEKHHKIHRAAAATNIVKSHRDTLIVSLISLMADAHLEPEDKPEGWPLSLVGKKRADAAKLLDAMDDETLREMQQILVAKMLHTSKKSDGQNGEDSFGALAEWYSASRDCDLTEHFTMDSEYLKAFTKPVIGQLLIEAGFDKDFEKDTGEGSFKKLINGKKPDILKAVKDSGFDFAGFIPANMKLKSAAK